MIQAVVFDLDGVLYFETALFGARLARDHGIPPPPFSPFYSSDFQDCLVGKADLKERLAPKLKEWGWTQGVDAFLRYWFNDGSHDPALLAFVQELKAKGVRCYLCTNNERYRVEHLTKKLSLDRVFHGVLASCALGVKKPEPALFAAICARTGLPPEEIAFCDDDPEHVAAAERAGFRAIRFTTLEDLKQRLAELGVNL